MSEAQEIQLGQEMDPRSAPRWACTPRGWQEYVQGVGLRLAKASERPDLPWHFAVVDVPAVNAFALPGGYIYITRGLLAHLDNEAEMAGVLGHEIGHVTARHAAQAHTRQTTLGLGAAVTSIFLPRPRLTPPRRRPASVHLPQVRPQPGSAVRKPRRPQLAGHAPAPADRLTKAADDVAAVEAANSGAQWTVNRDQYWQAAERPRLRRRPREGIVRGRQFIHPEMRFRLVFPEGWTIENGKRQVTARPAGIRDAMMSLELVPDAQGRRSRLSRRTRWARPDSRALAETPRA